MPKYFPKIVADRPAAPVRFSGALPSLSRAERIAYRLLGVQPIHAGDIRETVSALCIHAASHLPEDHIRLLRAAYDIEESPLARDVIRQLLINHLQAAQRGRPTCQDTGQVIVFAELGQDARIVGGELSDAINQGVALGYMDGRLRASVVRDPLFDRTNTGDNTPALVHVSSVPGSTLTLHLMEKGFGSENKSLGTVFLIPRGSLTERQDEIAKLVLAHLKKIGADWCPPGVLSIAVGFDLQGATLAAKRALLEPYDMDRLQQRAQEDPASLTPHELFRLKLWQQANGLGIGAQGLGGTVTVLDVKLTTGPTHIAGMPVAISVQCGKPAHASAVLDGSGAVTQFESPDYGALIGELASGGVTAARKIDLPLTPGVISTLQAGDRLLLNGRILTARDAAHQRIVGALRSGDDLPFDLAGQLLYYVGPVPAVPGEVVGPAGPTTASRMDSYTPFLLEATGLAGMIGKGERGPDVVEAIRRHGAVYMIAVGGAGYLQAQSIVESNVVAYADLGTEAVHEFTVRDFPVVVAVDSVGTNLHEIGRKQFEGRSPESFPFCPRRA